MTSSSRKANDPRRKTPAVIDESISDDEEQTVFPEDVQHQAVARSCLVSEDRDCDIPLSETESLTKTLDDLCLNKLNDSFPDEEEFIPLSRRLKLKTAQSNRGPTKEVTKTDTSDAKIESSSSFSVKCSLNNASELGARAESKAPETELAQRNSPEMTVSLRKCEQQRHQPAAALGATEEGEDKKLFNQNLTSSLADKDKVGVADVGQQVAKNKTKKRSPTLPKKTVTKGSHGSKKSNSEQPVAKKTTRAKMEKLHAIFHDETSLDLFNVSTESVQSPASMRSCISRSSSLQSTPVQNSLPGCCPVLPKPPLAQLTESHPSPIANSPTVPLYRADKAMQPFNASQLGAFNIELSLLNNLSCLSDGSLSVTRDADLWTVAQNSLLLEGTVASRTVCTDPTTSNTCITPSKDVAERLASGQPDAADSVFDDCCEDDKENFPVNLDPKLSTTKVTNAPSIMKIEHLANTELTMADSPVSLTERLRLRLSQKSQSKALAGLKTMSQSSASSEYEHELVVDQARKNNTENLDSSDIIFLD